MSLQVTDFKLPLFGPFHLGIDGAKQHPARQVALEGEVIASRGPHDICGKDDGLIKTEQPVSMQRLSYHFSQVGRAEGVCDVIEISDQMTFTQYRSNRLT